MTKTKDKDEKGSSGKGRACWVWACIHLWHPRGLVVNLYSESYEPLFQYLLWFLSVNWQPISRFLFKQTTAQLPQANIVAVWVISCVAQDNYSVSYEVCSASKLMLCTVSFSQTVKLLEQLILEIVDLWNVECSIASLLHISFFIWAYWTKVCCTATSKYFKVKKNSCSVREYAICDKMFVCVYLCIR